MVSYPTDDVFHERIVLCETIHPNYYVVTPDEDLYEETLATPPLSSVARSTASRAQL